MDDLQFAWDPDKAAANLRKHGVSFEDASTVFRILSPRCCPTPRIVAGSHARSSSGIPQEGALLLVVFTETDDQIRIISARDASARERREYEEHS